MIKRETIMAHRRVLNKMDYHPSTDTIRMLCDGALELLDALEGGPSIQARRAELTERERQVKLALTDLNVLLAEIQVAIPPDIEPAVVEAEPLLRDLSKARLMADLIIEMVKAKGPKWHREWSWYTPRIEEEFSEEVK